MAFLCLIYDTLFLIRFNPLLLHSAALVLTICREISILHVIAWKWCLRTWRVILCMHFINCKAGIFKELRLPEHRVCAELTCKIIDDYFRCLLKIDIQGREYIVPSFSPWNLMEIKTNEMRTSNCHDFSGESLLAIDWIIFLTFISFSRINKFVIISPFIEWSIMDRWMAIETSSLFPFAKWGRRIFVSAGYDIAIIDEIVKCKFCSIGEYSR